MPPRIVEHDCYVEDSNIDPLRELGLGFLTVDNDSARRLIVAGLEESGCIIEVGLSVHKAEGDRDPQVAPQTHDG